MGSNGITQLGSFTVCSVDKDGNKEFLGTLDGIKLMENRLREDRPEMTFSLLEPDEVTFTGKLTLLARIKLRLWLWKAKIQMWWAYRKFQQSFNKAAKAQARYERRLHHE